MFTDIAWGKIKDQQNWSDKNDKWNPYAQL
jgi:hypothetical protein